MAPAVTVIGAATSAGSHHAGQEHAPAALRSAGFVTRLTEAGLDVTDLGDVVTATFTPDAVTATARSLPEVVRVAGAVAGEVAARSRNWKACMRSLDSCAWFAIILAMSMPNVARSHWKMPAGWIESFNAAANKPSLPPK